MYSDGRNQERASMSERAIRFESDSSRETRNRNVHHKVQRTSRKPGKKEGRNILWAYAQTYAPSYGRIPVPPRVVARFLRGEPTARGRREGGSRLRIDVGIAVEGSLHKFSASGPVSFKRAPVIHRFVRRPRSRLRGTGRGDRRRPRRRSADGDVAE